jgi:hypothetical protein
MDSRNKRTKEPLIKSGSSRLSLKLFWFKAWSARNSRAIAKLYNAETGQFKWQDVDSRLNQRFPNSNANKPNRFYKSEALMLFFTSNCQLPTFKNHE